MHCASNLRSGSIAGGRAWRMTEKRRSFPFRKSATRVYRSSSGITRRCSAFRHRRIFGRSNSICSNLSTAIPARNDRRRGAGTPIGSSSPRPAFFISGACRIFPAQAGLPWYAGRRHSRSGCRWRRSPGGRGRSGKSGCDRLHRPPPAPICGEESAVGR